MTALILGAPGALGGCSSDAPANGGVGASDCNSIDYVSYKGGTTPSFKTDVMPIFGFGCTQGECHNSHDKKAGLDLGWRCKYTAPATPGGPFVCEYPAAEDPNATSLSSPKPLTPDVLAAAYASLMANAQTVTAPAIPRVIKGDPEHSFLIEKLANHQDQPAYMCNVTDKTRSTGRCGDSMPLGNEMLCAGTGRTRFDTVARWIAHDAPNN